MPDKAPFDAGTLPVRSPLPFTRKDVAIAAVIFVAALVLYVRTLAPDLLFGDSGEFQVLAITGGLAHAFGYPVYLAIAKLFTFLPFESVPARVSLVSSVFACSALAKVYLLGRSLNVRRFYSIIGALALMVSPLFWWQSIIAEVYSVGADCLIGCLLFAVIWRHTRNGWWLAAGGLLGGLSLGMHHSVLLAAPFVLIYIALAKAPKRDWSLMAGGAVLGSAISVVAYLVMGSINSPPTSTNFLKPAASHFGLKSASDFDDPMTRIKFVFFATQFKGEFKTRHIAPNVPRTAAEIQDDFGWAIPLFAVAGILALVLRRGRRKEALLLVGSYGILLFVPMLLEAFDIDVEFIQAHTLMCLLAAVGLQGVQDLLFKRRLLDHRMAWATAACATALYTVSAWGIWAGAEDAAVAGKATFLTGTRKVFPYEVDTPTRLHDIATAVLPNVPDKALLMIDWSRIDAFYYVALFEENKPNILMVAPYPTNPIPPSESDFIISYYLDQAKTRPLFSDSAPDGMNKDFIQSAVLVGESGTVYLYSVVPRRLQ